MFQQNPRPQVSSRLALILVALVIPAAATDHWSAAVAQVDPRPNSVQASGQPAGRRPSSDAWLLDAASDTDRFRRLEAVVRPEQAMHDIARRFTEIRYAIDSDNLALGRYAWEKATLASETAALMGSTNQQSVEDFFQRGPWRELGDALQVHDGRRADTAFEATRDACLACHESSGRAFLNAHPVFELTKSRDH
jgi:hypothetical protein